MKNWSNVANHTPRNGKACTVSHPDSQLFSHVFVAFHSAHVIFIAGPVYRRAAPCLGSCFVISTARRPWARSGWAVQAAGINCHDIYIVCMTACLDLHNVYQVWTEWTHILGSLAVCVYIEVCGRSKACVHTSSMCVIEQDFMRTQMYATETKRTENAWWCTH